MSVDQNGCRATAYVLTCAAVAMLTLGANNGPESCAAEPFATRPASKFNCNIATLTVGRDGKVYMTSLGPGNEGQVMRMNRDGTGRESVTVGPILFNATANAQGMHDTELFQRYDLRTGRLLNIVSAGEFKELLHPPTPSAVPA